MNHGNLSIAIESACMDFCLKINGSLGIAFIITTNYGFVCVIHNAEEAYTSIQHRKISMEKQMCVCRVCVSDIRDSMIDLIYHRAGITEHFFHSFGLKVLLLPDGNHWPKLQHNQRVGWRLAAHSMTLTIIITSPVMIFWCVMMSSVM